MILQFEPIEGLGEIAPGDDLAALIMELVRLHEHDVVVVTSKVVSKAAGLATTTDKETLVAGGHLVMPLARALAERKRNERAKQSDPFATPLATSLYRIVST